MPEAETQTTQENRFDLKSVVEASELLNTTLDLDFILSNLLLVAMSRLLVGKGMVLLADSASQNVFRVGAAKGAAGVTTGDVFELNSPAEIAEGGALPQDLRSRGFGLLLPIRHQRKTIGLVALGEKATDNRFEDSEVAFARSLVNMSASAVHSAQVGARLQQVNLDLASRVQELNTLFELSQVFGTTLDRRESLKLLGYALMGQMLVDRYAVLLSDASGQPLELVYSQGAFLEFGDEQIQALCSLSKPLRRSSNEVETNKVGEKILQAMDHLDVELAVPLHKADELRGLLLLSTRVSGKAYSDADITFVTSLGNLALTAIENADLVESRIEKERLEEELRLARIIQERLVPSNLPPIAAFEMTAHARASRHVAGDYFDAIPLAGGRHLLAIADVSGKGAPAALLMANLQAGLRLLRQEIDDSARNLADLTARLNRVVCENTDAASFITFIWGVLDPQSMSFTYVNAGHNPPRLVRNNGSAENLEKGGLILGVMPSAEYTQGTAILASGDTLFLYTDGVTEARNATGEEFGEDRLNSILRESGQMGVTERLQHVLSKIDEFVQDEPLPDDITMLLLRAT